MLKLQLKFKDTKVTELITDKGEIAIGRDRENDVHIDNLAVSSKHARIFKGPDRYAIEDLNSTNGTYVNGTRVMTRLLDDKDHITIGKHSITVEYVDDPSVKPEPRVRVTKSTYMLTPEERENLLKDK